MYSPLSQCGEEKKRREEKALEPYLGNRKCICNIQMPCTFVYVIENVYAIENRNDQNI